MKRIQYGSLNSRALFFDLSCPFMFSRWVSDPVSEWRLSPVRMLNPLNWLNVFTQKHYWAFSFSNHAGVNNRCYCDGGRSISISITIAGFFVRCWYSHFTGNVPCPCDEAFAEVFGYEEISDENILRESKS